MLLKYVQQKLELHVFPYNFSGGVIIRTKVESTKELMYTMYVYMYDYFGMYMPVHTYMYA